VSKPTRVNLSDKATWPKGWKKHEVLPFVFGPGFVLEAKFGQVWSHAGYLEESASWLPMPPAPTSRKWRTK